jgi:uncharacterized protein YjbI with pentapeptide repeats/tetratricopeptide (TPR) repeat protein
MNLKVLVTYILLLLPTGIAVAVQGRRIEQVNPLSTEYKFQNLQVQASSHRPAQIASQLDSDGCAVCMRDNTDWSGMNLRGANFWSSSLKGANFSQSDLRGANFNEANLTGANLRGANLSQANLRKANLSHADLTDAQLQGSDLQDAILFGAKLQNANLQGAKLVGAILPAGFTGGEPTLGRTQPIDKPSVNPANLETIAREVTVLVGGKCEGSGVIIAKSGKTYYVATAKHVVSDYTNQCFLQTHDGKQHQLKSNATKVFSEVDMAVLQFTSNQNYRVARLANSDLLYGVVSTPTPIYTAGFPSKSLNSARRYVLSQGQVMRNSPGDMSAGYGLFYTNSTLPGMSGGPVLDRDGRVVGIHGRGFSQSARDENDVEFFIKYDISLGVPINTLVKLASQAGIQLPVQIDASAPRQGRAVTSEFSTLGSQNSNNRTAKVARLCNQGFDLLFSNQLPAAMAKFTEAAQLKPESKNLNALIWYGAGSVFQAAGKPQDAIDAYSKALELQPDFYPASLEKGYILHQVRRYPEAIATLNQVINDNSNDDLYRFFKAQALLWRGQAHFAQDNLQGAIQDYSEAIRANPDYAFAYFQRASVYQVLRNKSAAIQDYQQASRIYLALGNMAAYQNARQILSFLQK